LNVTQTNETRRVGDATGPEGTSILGGIDTFENNQAAMRKPDSGLARNISWGSR